MKRSKSNLTHPKPPEPIILGAEERKRRLAMVHVWRCFNQYLAALMEVDTC